MFRHDKQRIERSLRQVAQRLNEAKQELAVAEEQASYFEGLASEASIKALVSETPLAVAQAQEAKRHEQTMIKHRDSQRKLVGDLVAEQDRLLEQLSQSS